MRAIRMKILAGLFLAGIMFADKKVSMGDLPPAVQVAVKEQTKTATLVGLSTEVEKGKTMYEAETKVNGKSRDLLFDASGALVETEDEVDLDSIPGPAKTALQKKAGTGTIQKVEKLTQGSSVAYEATIKNKAGKKMEAAVNADGTPHKE
jgi:uncharacterized protein with beta-barrel porin domain